MRRFFARLARADARLATFALLALLASWPALSTAGRFNDFRDAQLLWSYEESARRTVLEFGQLPLWDPSICGGVYALGGPQTRFAAPSLLLTLVFGTSAGAALLLFFMLLLALEGAFQLLRARGSLKSSAVLAAPIFGLCGLLVCAPTLGWHNFLGLALLPWALLGIRRAAQGAPWAPLLVAAALAWAIGMGGTALTPILAVAVGLEVVLLALARRGRLRWSWLAAALALCVALSAFRLLPIADELGRVPRVIGGGSAHSPLVLSGLLFGLWPPFTHAAWSFVGPVAGVVALLGPWRRRRWTEGLAALLWAWLAMGYWARPALFGWLKALPLFSMLRYPERFIFPVSLVLALACASAMQAAWARGRGASRWQRSHRRLAQVMAIALCLNVGLLGHNAWLALQGVSWGEVPAQATRPFHQARGNRWLMASFGSMARGSLACWEAYPLRQSAALRADASEEAWAVEGKVKLASWSPQRLELSVDAPGSTKVIINQNYHHGWRSSVGQIVSDEGLLAVEVPAGTHAVTLAFWPRSAVLGGLISLLALLAGLMLWWRARLSALLLIPLAGLAMPLLPEERPLQPVGSAELSSGVMPEGARSMGVRFEGGVELVAAHSELLSQGQVLKIELDWRRDARVREDLGVFLHVEPEGEKTINADHPTLGGGMLTFERAPAGVVLRDVVTIDLSRKHLGRKLTLWAGLWALRGDGRRMAIVDARGHRVVDGRVFLGTLENARNSLSPPPASR